MAIDCFVRAAAFGESIDITIETLHEYERRALIDEVTVEAWPDELPLTDDPEHSIVARYDLFQTWADKHGVSLQPAFATRERTTLVSDTAETVLVLPVLCLAIHIDGDLASVVPHHTATTTYTVADALADLEAVGQISMPGTPPTDERPDQPARDTDANHTPLGS